MAGGPVGVGEHRVSRLAHQPVAERVLAFAGEAGVGRRRRRAPGRRAPASHAVRSALPGAAPISRATPPRQKASPNTLAARSDPPRFGFEPLEPRLDQREHRLGERVAVALGHPPDQLLEIEGVAVRPLARCARRSRRRDVARAPCVTSLSARAGCSRRGRCRSAPRLPRVPERLVHLGARQREHHEGPLRRARAARRPGTSRSARRPSAGPRAPTSSGRAAHSAVEPLTERRRSHSPMSRGSLAPARSCGLGSRARGRR